MSVVIDFHEAISKIAKPKDGAKVKSVPSCSDALCPYRLALEKSNLALEKIADVLLELPR